MTRYISIILILFMIAPIFTPLAEAMGQCAEECAVGQGHECRHGKSCTMHKKKGANHGHQGHAVHEGRAGHQGHQGEDLKSDKDLICTVSDTGEKERAQERRQECLIMSGCDHGEDSLSPVLGADYLISRTNFELVKKTGFVKPVKHLQYQGPAPDLIERPPSA